MQKYEFDWEVVDCRETKREALQSVKNYRENQPASYRIKRVKST